MLWQLADDADPSVRAAVARRPVVPRALLERLAVDINTRVRLAVAGSRSTPRDLLGLLAADRVKAVQRQARAFRAA
jgi:hypothetical protein